MSEEMDTPRTFALYRPTPPSDYIEIGVVLVDRVSGAWAVDIWRSEQCSEAGLTAPEEET